MGSAKSNHIATLHPAMSSCLLKVGTAMNIRNNNKELKYLRFLFMPYELDYWYDHITTAATTSGGGGPRGGCNSSRFIAVSSKLAASIPCNSHMT